MNLYFYICFSLARESSRLMEVIVRLLLTRLLLRYNRRIQSVVTSCSFAAVKMIPVSLLFCLLVITNVKGLPSCDSCWCLLLSDTVHKAPSNYLIMRVLHWYLLAWGRGRPSQQLALILSLDPTIWIEPLWPRAGSARVAVICRRSWGRIIKVVWCDRHLDVSWSTRTFRTCAFISIAI